MNSLQGLPPTDIAASFLRARSESPNAPLAAEYETYRASVSTEGQAAFNAFIGDRAPAVAQALRIGPFAPTEAETTGATALAAMKATQGWIRTAGTDAEPLAQQVLCEVLAALPREVLTDVATRLGYHPFRDPSREPLAYASDLCKSLTKDDRRVQLFYRVGALASGAAGMKTTSPKEPPVAYTTGKGEATLKPRWVDGFVLKILSYTDRPFIEKATRKLFNANLGDIVNERNGNRVVLTDLVLELAKTRPIGEVANTLVDELVRYDGGRVSARTFIEV